jgi:repressor LexA
MLAILLYMGKALTDRQQLILGFVQSFTQGHGYPPSIREIGEQFSISPPSVLSHLKAIERKGFIRRMPFKPRCLEVLKQKDAAA